jgi:hypothetical protein
MSRVQVQIPWLVVLALSAWGCLELPRDQLGAMDAAGLVVDAATLDATDAAEGGDLARPMVDASRVGDSGEDQGADAGDGATDSEGAEDVGAEDVGADMEPDSVAAAPGPNCPDGPLADRVAAVCRFAANCAVVHCAYEGEACAESIFDRCVRGLGSSDLATLGTAVVCPHTSCIDTLQWGGMADPSLARACADGAAPITCEVVDAGADAGP